MHLACNFFININYHEKVLSPVTVLFHFYALNKEVKGGNLTRPIIPSGPFSIYSMDFPWLSKLGETEMKGLEKET